MMEEKRASLSMVLSELAEVKSLFGGVASNWLLGVSCGCRGVARSDEKVMNTGRSQDDCLLFCVDSMIPLLFIDCDDEAR